MGELAALPPGKISMIYAKYNKPRKATQAELEELCAYEATRRYRETADPEFAYRQLQEDIAEVAIAVWDADEYWRKRMLVIWGQEYVSFYAWDLGGIHPIRMYETEFKY